MKKLKFPSPTIFSTSDLRWISVVPKAFDESGGDRRIRIGLIKTLENDLNAMRIMGEACGVLQFYVREYLAQKLDNLLPDYSKFFIFWIEYMQKEKYCRFPVNRLIETTQTLEDFLR